MANTNRAFDWVSCLLGVLFILGALIAFDNPAVSLLGIVVYFAVTAIINGVYTLFIRNRIKDLVGQKFIALLILAIAEIFIGVVFLFRLDAGIIALAYVFALWFIIVSLRNLFFLGAAKLVSNAYYWFTLIINLLGLVVGISLCFNPVTSLLTLSFLVGFYLLLTGIIYLVSAFSH